MFNLKSLLILFFVTTLASFAQPKKHSPILSGYWEGEYPMGPEYKIVLHFIEENPEESDFLRIYKGSSLFGGEDIQDYSFDGVNLSFRVHVVSADFTAQVEGSKLTGRLAFPNSQEAEFVCEKVTAPFYASNTENSGDKIVDILTHKYPVAQLMEDFKFLIDTVKKYQPNLFTFTSPAEFNGIINNAAMKLKEEKTELEFLRILTTVTEKVGCGHLGVGPSQESMKLQSQIKLIPFFVKFIEGKLYISESFAADNVDIEGYELLSINSRKTEDYINEMLDGISTDGRNYSSKYAIIENYFPSLYASHIEIEEVYTIECRKQGDTEVRKIKLNGLPFIRLMKDYVAQHPEKARDGFPVTAKNIDANISYIKVTQFYYKDKEKYDYFLDSLFGDYRKREVKNLIIDVRGNQGGHPPFSFKLLSYIADQDFQYFASPVKFKRYYEDLFDINNISPLSFDGDVYILMDGGCKSSTGHFLALANYHNMALLIGRETGSTYYCNDGSFTLELPNTKIQLNQPRDEVITKVKGFNKLDPLRPDHEVSFTIEDLNSGNDPDLEYALVLIKENE